MDKIIMKDLSFYAYHGVLKEENTLGQKYFVDLEIICDLEKPSKTDEVTDTINYADIYQIVKKVVLENEFKLIERLAEEIAKKILSYDKKILEVGVTIRKPEAPIDGIFDYVGVEIWRKQDG